MTESLDPTRQILRAASAVRGRLGVAKVISAAGLALSIGSVVAITALIAGRSLGGGLLPQLTTEQWGWMVGSVLATGLAVGIAVGWWRRPSLLASASVVDRFYKNQDALATALELDAQGRPEGFSLLAIADAQEKAKKVIAADVVRYAPAVKSKAWKFVPAAGLGLVVAALWMPNLNLGKTAANVAPAQEDTQPTIAGAKVSEVVESAKRVVASIPAASSQREIEAIADLERELASGKKVSPTTARAAAGVGEAIAQRLDGQAAEKQREDRELRQALVEKLTANASRPQRTGDLATALRSGDLTAAAAAAEDLSRQAEALSLEDRESLAQELEELAKALNVVNVANEPESASSASSGDISNSNASSRGERGGEGGSLETGSQSASARSDQSDAADPVAPPEASNTGTTSSGSQGTNVSGQRTPPAPPSDANQGAAAPGSSNANPITSDTDAGPARSPNELETVAEKMPSTGLTPPAAANPATSNAANPPTGPSAATPAQTPEGRSDKSQETLEAPSQSSPAGATTSPTSGGSATARRERDSRGEKPTSDAPQSPPSGADSTPAKPGPEARSADQKSKAISGPAVGRPTRHFGIRFTAQRNPESRE